MKSNNDVAKMQAKTDHQPVGKRIVDSIKDLAKRQQAGCYNDSSGGGYTDNQVGETADVS